MGAWFLATAVAQHLAGKIAEQTSVAHGKSAVQIVPPPRETVGIYGGVFGKIAIVAVASSILCLAMAPLLDRWMHAEEDAE
jgi:POT family proton-dependent oligopeptide transporter